MDEANARLGLMLRKGGVSDDRLIEAFNTIPRNLFLPSEYQAHAYTDEAVNIGFDQVIMPPSLQVFILMKAQIEERHKVLEIGTGTAFQTALIAKLCRRVYSLEWHRQLYLDAVQRLGKLSISNATCMSADGIAGWSGQEPFDRIIINAAMSHISGALAHQLKIGGSMIVPISGDNDPETGQNRQRLLKITRKQQSFVQQDLIGVRFKEIIQSDSI